MEKSGCWEQNGDKTHSQIVFILIQVVCAYLCVVLFTPLTGCNLHQYLNTSMINHSDSGVHLLFGSLETLAHILPVDDIPDSLNIVRPHIFVLKIVGMLPYINTKKRDET